MSRLREEDDPYVVEEPSDEERALSRCLTEGRRAAGGCRFPPLTAGAAPRGRPPWGCGWKTGGAPPSVSPQSVCSLPELAILLSWW